MTLLKSETVVFPGAVADGVRAAVQSTFASICGGSLTLAPEPNPVAGGPGLVGIISFLGDVNWSFALGLPRDTVTALAARFAGFDIPFDSADMCDVVGELANVVAGDIVAQLDARRLKAQMSLPMVARGSDLEVESPGNMASLRVACRSPQGPFWYRLAAARSGGFLGRRPGT
ncbi:MAG TPA: chemotaxis protein CheX [Gemmataceae bacterium]|nr:chemotaxis protein CheX [Gemmataceae bacterium]